jgi:hypothetical protein
VNFALTPATAVADTPGHPFPGGRRRGQTPSSAAADAANSSITPDDPVGADDCTNLCAKWVTTCKGAASAMRACWNSAVAKLAALRKATCNTLTDAAQKTTCKMTVKAERDTVKAFLETDAANAVLFCTGAGLAACITNCG